MAKEKDLSPAKAQRIWTSELNASKTELDKFTKQGHKTSKAYLDVRGESDKNDLKFNLFNVNVNQLRDALFARIPKPAVSRTHNDPMDAVGRVASEILQRNLMLELNEQSGQADDFKNMIKDRLIAGLGCAWVRYDATYGQTEPLQLSDSIESDTDDMDTASEYIKDERCPIDYVNWQDIAYSPARVWSEVRWVGRRTFMTVEDFQEAFPDASEADHFVPEDVNSGVPKTDDPNGIKNNVVKEIEVWEIWDKVRGKVFFVREGANEVLSMKDDPFGLPHYFPCPQFLMGDTTTSRLVPQADYVNAQDTYQRVNNIVGRISDLVAQAKVRGVYNGDFPELEDLLNPATSEGTMIAIEKWGDLQQSSGLKGAVDFVPVTEFIAGIQMLRSELAATQKELNSLTGIPDIMQGATSPYETNGAQQLKAGYAGGRMQSVQIEVAEFFSDLMRIKAFLMVKFYEPQRLVQRAGKLMDTDQPFLQPAVQLLKDQLLSNILISVSVDALQRPNAAQDQQARTQALQALGGLVQQAPPEMQKDLMPMMMKGAQWLISSFSGSEELQGIVDETLNKITQAPPQPAPDDKANSAQQAMQLQQAAQEQEKAKAQFEAAQAQQAATFQAQIDQKKAEFAMQMKQMEIDSTERIANKKIEVDAAKVKLEELKLNQEGIDTTGIELPVGDGTPSMRVSKPEVAQMLMQHQDQTHQAIQDHTNNSQVQMMHLFQQMMTSMTGQMQLMMVDMQKNQQQLAMLLTAPPPSANLTTYRDASGNLHGRIE